MGKQLLKRVLPMLLAVAMVATSVPANINAMELPKAAEEVTEAEVIEEVTDAASEIIDEGGVS